MPALLIAYALTLYVVFAVKPVMLLVKLPVPAPSVVLLSAMVGAGPMLQQTPQAVTVEPPSEVTVPPLVAVVCAILLTADVVNTAMSTGCVVKDTALP